MKVLKIVMKIIKLNPSSSSSSSRNSSRNSSIVVVVVGIVMTLEIKYKY
jgi:hypothetical protein